jgi:gamma-glutamyltranspeptidase/glutathione hydrolase
MTPVIVIENDRPLLIAGGSGGPLIITATLQAVLNVVDFDMTAAAAIGAARFHHQWLPDVLVVEPGIDGATRSALTRLGHSVRELRNLGAVQAIRVSPAGYDGAADPRKGGGTAAW